MPKDCSTGRCYEVQPAVYARPSQPMCGVVEETWGKPKTISVDGQTEDMHKRMVADSFNYDQNGYDKALTDAAKRGVPVVAVFGSWEKNNAKQTSEGLAQAKQNGARDAVYVFIDPAKCKPGSELQKFAQSALEGGHNNAVTYVFNVKPDAQTGEPEPDTPVFTSLGLHSSRIDSFKSALNHAQAQADKYNKGNYNFPGDLPAAPKAEQAPKPTEVAPKPVEPAPKPQEVPVQPTPAKTFEPPAKPQEVTPPTPAPTAAAGKPEVAPTVPGKVDAPAAPGQLTAKEKELQAALDQAQAELKKLQEQVKKAETSENPNDKNKRRQEDLITFAEGAGSALLARWLFNRLRGGGAGAPGEGPKPPEGPVDPEVDRAAKKALALPENATNADIERAAKERLGITSGTSEAEMQQKIQEKMVNQAKRAYELPANASIEEVRRAVLADQGAKLKQSLGLPADATPADILAKVVAEPKATPELPAGPKALPEAKGPNPGEPKALPEAKGPNPGEPKALPEAKAPNPGEAKAAPEVSGRVGPLPTAEKPLVGAPEMIKLEGGNLVVTDTANPTLELDAKSGLKDIFEEGYNNRKAEIEKRLESKDKGVRERAQAELETLEAQKKLFMDPVNGTEFRANMRAAVVEKVQAEIKRAGGKALKTGGTALSAALVFNWVMEQFDENGKKKH